MSKEHGLTPWFAYLLHSVYLHTLCVRFRRTHRSGELLSSQGGAVARRDASGSSAPSLKILNSGVVLSSSVSCSASSPSSCSASCATPSSALCATAGSGPGAASPTSTSVQHEDQQELPSPSPLHACGHLTAHAQSQACAHIVGQAKGTHSGPDAPRCGCPE